MFSRGCFYQLKYFMPNLSQSRALKPTSETSRSLALRILLKVERSNLFADEVFNRLTYNSKLSRKDRALAFALVCGVLRHRGNLDWRLNALTIRPLQSLPNVIVMILRLGAYQLLHLDRIPESAAVNESVELAKTVKSRDWSGVINGVLRSLIRQGELSSLDPSDDPVEALSILYSCPTWLTERWIGTLGLDLAEKVCQQSIAIPPLTIRTNTLRCSREQLKQRLQREGYMVRRTLVSPVGLIMDKFGPLTNLKPLEEGWCYVEDEAAQLVPFLLNVQPGQRLLDACAAPGGKSTHLAALMRNEGEIVSMDRSGQRLKTLRENMGGLGITCIRPKIGTWAENVKFPSSLSSMLDEGFDGILVDTPCSGLGVLRRHPEAKWQKTNQRLFKHQRIQGEILNRVSTHLRPGGVLVYSACSTEPEETLHVISRFCQDHPEFQHESALPFLPPGSEDLINSDGNLMTLGSVHDMDGFFAARLRRT